jgi:choline dehydrogenase
VSKNIKDGNRMSSALTYLSQARSHDNLTIIDQAKVLKLDWKKGKNVVKGVEAEIAGRQYTFCADHIVLCAGVINTPSLMMYSGIGDPQTLRSVNITPQVPLIGVGRNLVDHPVVALWASPKQGVSYLDEPNHQVLLNYTSEGSSYRNDMNIYMLSGIDTTMIPILKNALGSSIGVALGVCLMKPHSRGRITLHSSSITSAPEITVNCLAEIEDQRRMIQGVRIAWDIFKHRKIHSKLDYVLAWTDAVVQSDTAISHAISTFVRPSWHAVGTAKMGNNAEEGAVVDAKGRVFGVKNLWVADASIMPSIPRVPTYLSTVMIAETIVAGLRNRSS